MLILFNDKIHIIIITVNSEIFVRIFIFANRVKIHIFLPR